LDCINSAKLLSIADYEPGKKLPAHISPFYEFSDDGHIKVDKKIVEYNSNEVQRETKLNQNDEEREDIELKEMLISKNKKKMLDRLREEQSKKKKVPKIKTNENNTIKN
jgi:hypothetical protein